MSLRIRILRIIKPKRLVILRLALEWLNNQPVISINWPQILKMVMIPAKDKKVLNKAIREMSGMLNFRWKSSKNNKK